MSRLQFAGQARSTTVRRWGNVRILISMISFLLLGCDDEDSPETSIPSRNSNPTQSELAQAERIADQAEAGAIVPKHGIETLSSGSDDLAVLGGEADQNQQAFRQRFGLSDPTKDQVAMPDSLLTRTRMRIGHIRPPHCQTGWRPPRQTVILLLSKAPPWRSTSVEFPAAP